MFLESITWFGSSREKMFMGLSSALGYFILTFQQKSEPDVETYEQHFTYFNRVNKSKCREVWGLKYF